MGKKKIHRVEVVDGVVYIHRDAAHELALMLECLFLEDISFTHIWDSNSYKFEFHDMDEWEIKNCINYIKSNS